MTALSFLAKARLSLGEAPFFCVLTAIVIGLSLILGGGTVQGLPSDAAAQLASLPLLALALSRLADQARPSMPGWPLAIAGTIMVLPLVQLIPLPPWLWTHVPGREMVVTSFTAAGLELPFRPLSLDPAATWRSFLSLLPAVSVFLAVISLDAKGRRSLTLIAVAVGLVAVLVGLAQLMQGPNSALYRFEFTNRGSSVGFFANRNHHAAFLYSLVPFAAAWAIGLISDGRRTLRFAVIWSGLIMAALLLGTAMTLSRMGIMGAVASLVLSLLILDDGRRGRFRRDAFYVMLGVSLLGAILIAHYALLGLLDRFERDTIEDYRFDILPIAWATAKAFMPFGSGFGTFESAYLIFDRPEALLGNYVNHAHNDWVELLIEGGILGAAAAGAFLVWYGAASWRAWRRPEGGGAYLDLALTRAASIAIALVLLHSLVDYPLRTTAILTLFGLCCALMIKPPGAQEPVRKRRRAHRAGQHSGKVAMPMPS